MHTRPAPTALTLDLTLQLALLRASNSSSAHLLALLCVVPHYRRAEPHKHSVVLLELPKPFLHGSHVTQAICEQLAGKQLAGKHCNMLRRSRACCLEVCLFANV